MSFAKYPPIGRRGFGLNRAQNYGFSFEEYREWVDEHQVIICQIEHIDGIRNYEDIIQVPGIDGFIIGPYDLSGSLGVPGNCDHADVVAALEEFKRVSTKHRKAMGFHVIEPDHKILNAKISEGYNFIAFGVDFKFMGIKAVDEMKGLQR